MILVTGATVNFGRDAVEQLQAAGHPVRGLTRDPGKADLPRGVRVGRGDPARAGGRDRRTSWTWRRSCGPPRRRG